MARPKSRVTRDDVRSALQRNMKEVFTKEPSTVKRAKHFGPGGKTAMLRAIAYSKTRKGE